MPLFKSDELLNSGDLKDNVCSIFLVQSCRTSANELHSSSLGPGRSRWVPTATACLQQHLSHDGSMMRRTKVQSKSVWKGLLALQRVGKVFVTLMHSQLQTPCRFARSPEPGLAPHLEHTRIKVIVQQGAQFVQADHTCIGDHHVTFLRYVRFWKKNKKLLGR